MLQALANGLAAGTQLALPALGLAVIFQVQRFFNFALAALITMGAYAAWVANTHAKLPMLPCLVVAFVAAGALGVLADSTALERLRRSHTAQALLGTAIASIALMIALQAITRFLFGNDLRSFDLPLERDIRVLDIRVSPQQAKNCAAAIAILGAVWALFRFTRVGKAMRAAADNPLLARLKGIDPRAVGRHAVFLGAGLAGIGGALVGLDTSIDPLTGERLLLSVFAACVVGGITSLPGAVAGAMIIGLAEEIALLAVSPTYRSAVGFAVICLVLLVRPYGLFGDKN
jgi:branched-subunit amino acid ABC-type transport system permease component